MCWAAITSDDISIEKMEYSWYERCIQNPIRRLFTERINYLHKCLLEAASARGRRVN